MDEIKMAGWTIIANRREADIPAQLAFWLDEHSPQYRKLNALTGEEKGRDKIALWYQEKENIEYILGPIVESFDNLPEDAFQVTIGAGIRPSRPGLPLDTRPNGNGIEECIAIHSGGTA